MLPRRGGSRSKSRAFGPLEDRPATGLASRRIGNNTAMPKAAIKPPAPPNLVAAREAEKQAQAATAQDQSDEEAPEASHIEEIRGHLHDAIESAATALNLLDDLEARAG
jgi:hypothetical protein